VHDREALWLAHQRRRWMLPDPSRWLQPDQSRWAMPQPDERKYSPNQPRVPAGNLDGGQWTNGGGGFTNDHQEAQDRLEQSLTTAPDQPSRSDLSQLQDIANGSLIRSRIDEAWNASNPYGTSLQEQGFWICRNETTGEFFTRPFANAGSARSITPGPTPSDAVAFFHTHPLKPDFGGIPGPSRSDVGFATAVGLPGLFSHIRECIILALLLKHVEGRKLEGIFVARTFKRRAGIATVAALQLMANQTMSQPKCNMFQVAEDYIAKRYPFIDLAERHPVTSESDNVWEVGYELPRGTLGFVPIISVDKRTCAVVRAQVEQ
jgi:hypothetical protein